MSSSRLKPHRRQPQPIIISSPLSPCSSDEARRIQIKRACSQPLTNDASNPHKRDVGIWRRRRRFRRDNSPPNIDDMFLRERQNTTSSSNPSFPATSAEFRLRTLPNRITRSCRVFRSPNLSSISPSISRSNADLASLRSNAFWELHRSVTENGEGLIRRMRDYEHSRSRIELYQKAREAHKRGHKRSSISSRKPAKVVIFDTSDEEEEVQIFAGKEPDGIFSKNSFRKRRTSSIDFENEDSRHFSYASLPLFGRDPCSLPGLSSPSSYLDDNESQIAVASEPHFHRPFSSDPDQELFMVPRSPTLTYSVYDSPESSIISLKSLPSSLTSHQIHTFPDSSSPEKAIAALSLALANGAGGINDYADLHAIQSCHISDNCNIGELWH